MSSYSLCLDVKYDKVFLGSAITFGGNEATKKTKKNQLKQQYDNFKAEGTETLEQTFNRLQAIIDEDDIEEMDIKWNMALLSVRADRFWKKTRKKISIQGSAEHPGAKTGAEEKTTNKVQKKKNRLPRL
nr:hypothetical protein [Tanacetum cinerariifolium]